MDEIDGKLPARNTSLVVSREKLLGAFECTHTYQNVRYRTRISIGTYTLTAFDLLRRVSNSLGSDIDLILIYTCVRLYVSTYVHIDIYVYVCEDVCKRVYVCVYIYNKGFVGGW